VIARRLLVVALALSAACSGTSTRPGLRLNGPSAVAVFHGVTTRDAATLRAYLAVANERGDDLRILDAADGQAVLAPGLVMSLSVPTAPRPALLAAGGLADAGGVAKADLLVVAPAGLVACDSTAPTVLSGCIQVVATWEAATAIKTSLRLDLGVLGAADAEVLSLTVVAVPEPAVGGGWQATPGKARVVAGLSGGRLLLADYARAADGVAIALLGAAVHDLAPSTATGLGFDPVSLSGSPDLAHLYAASPDPIGGVEGVAELDLTGPFGQAPTLRALAVGAPTSHVLAAAVRPFVALTSDPLRDQHGPEVVRVYAAIDRFERTGQLLGADLPERCGRAEELTCGLAVLDPAAGGLAADPAGELPAHLPIAIPGTVRGLVAVYPPSVGGLLEDGTPAPSGTRGAFQKQATSTGTRWTSTLAAVGSSTGVLFLVDLAHGTLAAENPVLATQAAGSQARVVSASSSTPPVAGQPFLALWDERTTPAVPTHDGAELPALVRITPGYTPSDSWTLAWEGLLPGLTALKAQVQSTGTGLAWLAVQSSAGATADSGPYRGVGRLYDARLALSPGDIAVVTPVDAAACPRGTFELAVTDLLYPSADFPGGAVAVTPLPDDRQPKVQEGGVEVPANPHCLDAAGRSSALVTFRAGGLLLTGTTFGYAGRPEAQADATGPAYSLAWEDPAPLACPMLQGAAWPPPACDPACRDRCERLLLSRKARRAFYLAERCAAADTACTARWAAIAGAGGEVVNPLGPVLAFKVAKQDDGGVSTATLARGTTLAIGTVGGQVGLLRRPLVGGQATAAALPAGLATFDRAGATLVEADGVRVYAAYPGNLVLDLSPAQPAASNTVHR
jgi:hypothetical protein